MNFHKPPIDLASTAVGVGLGLVDFEGPQIDIALKNANASKPFENSRDLIRTAALAGGLLGASMSTGKIETVSSNLFYEALPLFTESVANAVITATSSTSSSALQPSHVAPSPAPIVPARQSFVQQKVPVINLG